MVWCLKKVYKCPKKIDLSKPKKLLLIYVIVNFRKLKTKITANKISGNGTSCNLKNKSL